MNSRESGIEDYLGFLQSLWSKHPSQFLFGGQAVNFWAEYFDRQIRPGQLDAFRPFTSKDCDVWVSAPVWKEIKHEEIDRLVLGSSPADGQLGLLTLQQSPLRFVDLFSGVYGIRQSDLARGPFVHGGIHERMKAQPITSIAALSQATELTPITLAASLAKLAKMGVVKETTGGRYGRLYAYDGYLKILAPHE